MDELVTLGENLIDTAIDAGASQLAPYFWAEIFSMASVLAILAGAIIFIVWMFKQL